MKVLRKGQVENKIPVEVLCSNCNSHLKLVPQSDPLVKMVSVDYDHCTAYTFACPVCTHAVELSATAVYTYQRYTFQKVHCSPLKG